MFVVWKRPDGFHGAVPTDFKVVDIGEANLWLHRSDRDQFPFRISGGWEENAGKRLNNLINLLGDSQADLTEYMVEIFHDSMKDKPEEFFADLISWFAELRNNLKGDKWEVEIMSLALKSVEQRLVAIRNDFVRQVTAAES